MPPPANGGERMAYIEAMLRRLHPNPDGEDYELYGKYHLFRPTLTKIRDRLISEETMLRRTNWVKEEVIPLWQRLRELSEGESEELKAVFHKYNGPESIRQRCIQEYADLKARIAASEDAPLLEDMDPCPVVDKILTEMCFSFHGGGSILYSEMWKQLERRDNGRSAGREDPVINLVPLGAGDVIPHHNKNPDDDLSLNPTLLGLLHRMMASKHAPLFINLDDEARDLGYYYEVRKPRWLKFIEHGLKSGASVGYGATAFFNDLLLLFRQTDDYYAYAPDMKYTYPCRKLETHMKNLLKEMGSVGEQLLALYKAIDEQGHEYWADPEIVYFQDHYHPRSPGFDGSKPDEDIIRAVAWQQLRLGQERVRDLRRRLASKASDTAEIEHAPAPDGEAPSGQESRKQAHEENAAPDQDIPDGGPKRQRSSHNGSPGPSAPAAAAPLGRAASKRPREQADDDGDDDAAQETGQGEKAESRAAKRQRLTKAVAPSNLPATSSGASVPSSSAAPQTRSASKRARTPADDDNDGDDQADGDSHGASGSKRRRLTKDTSSAGLPVASPAEAGPSSTAGKSTNEPAAHISGSSQAQASSSSGQAAAQQPQQQADFPAPSSQAFNSSRTTVAMKKIVKMGKSRPWVFGYSTDEGYGIYAFMKCPGQNCKHRFSGHPLKGNQVRDHLMSCGQPFADEQDMVRQYASQVIKDADRKSDLTIDWARKSNMSLLPSNAKDNHPDNFASPPAAE